jgi:hypothetical protein
MALDWNWSDLISGAVGVVLGWLAKVFHLGSTTPTQGGK